MLGLLFGVMAITFNSPLSSTFTTSIKLSKNSFLANKKQYHHHYLSIRKEFICTTVKCAFANISNQGNASIEKQNFVNSSECTLYVPWIYCKKDMHAFAFYTVPEPLVCDDNGRGKTALESKL